LDVTHPLTSSAEAACLKTDSVSAPVGKGKPSLRGYVIRKISFKGVFGLVFIFPENEKKKWKAIV
jgi:hypothetical protein